MCHFTKSNVKILRQSARSTKRSSARHTGTAKPTARRKLFGPSTARVFQTLNTYSVRKKRNLWKIYKMDHTIYVHRKVFFNSAKKNLPASYRFIKFANLVNCLHKNLHKANWDNLHCKIIPHGSFSHTINKTKEYLEEKSWSHMLPLTWNHVSNMISVSMISND